MKNNLNPGRKPLRFEHLEDRSMLSANVTASVTDNCLNICGDAKGDKFAVHQLQSGDWLVTGIGGTKINGSTSNTFSDVDCINIHTLGGNDAVAVVGGCLSGSLTVCTDGGNDIVALGLLKVGSVCASTGDGNDALIVTGLETLSQPTEPAPTIAPLSVESGSSGSACFDMGDGTNIALLAAIKASNLSFTSGKGTDYVGLIGVCVDECLAVDTGKGADILGVIGSSASFASFKCGKNPGDLMITAKNSFGESNSDFGTTIKLDPIFKSLSSMFKSVKSSVLSTMDGFGTFPDFTL